MEQVLLNGSAANPVIFTYTESPGSGERYAVHAGGEISRPAIGMGPSGRWIFIGVRGSGGGFMHLSALLAMLASGTGRQGLSKACYIRDRDGPTYRDHGAALADIRLASDLPTEWRAIVQARLSERVVREEEERQRKAHERVAIANKGGRTIATIEGIKVRKNGTGYCVIDGEEAAIGLNFDKAAQVLGAALIERNA